MSRTVAGFAYRAAGIEEILDLRHRVLIVGTTRTTADFDGDRDASTRHFGAFARSDTAGCVACVSYVRANVGEETAYQLRGMAVAPELQDRGIGSALLAYAENQLRAETRVHVFWCNARIRAVGFYRRHGWEVVGDVFEIEGVGPHRRLIKRLNQ